MTRVEIIQKALEGRINWVQAATIMSAPVEASNHDWILFVNQKIPAPVTRSKHPRVITDDLMFAREAIKLGVGIGVLPVFLTFQDVTAVRLVRLIPRWSYEPFTLFFVHPAKRHVPKKVSAFREYVLAYLAGHPFTVQR